MHGKVKSTNSSNRYKASASTADPIPVNFRSLPQSAREQNVSVHIRVRKREQVNAVSCPLAEWRLFLCPSSSRPFPRGHSRHHRPELHFTCQWPRQALSLFQPFVPINDPTGTIPTRTLRAFKHTGERSRTHSQTGLPRDSTK